MKKRPTIKIDNREEVKVIDGARKAFNVEVEMLEVGDVQFGDLIIERKEVGDFIKSIFDGRLSEQPINMARFPFRFIIIEGDFDDLRATDEYYRGYSNEMIYGKIASLEINYDIRVLQVKTTRGFWVQVDRLVYHSSNPKAVEYAKTYKPKLTCINKKDEVLSALCGGVFGMGEKKGLLVTETYSTIHEICHASIEDLCEIKGIGPKMAEKIKEVFY